MNYFTYEALLEAHDMVLAVSGGMPGVKDGGLIRSPVEFISEGQYYPTFADKLTHLVYSLIKNHGFNDGNKRTAFRVMQTCLDLHGHSEPLLPEDQTGQIIIRVARGLMDEGALADWLRGR